LSAAFMSLAMEKVHFKDQKVNYNQDENSTDQFVSSTDAVNISV